MRSRILSISLSLILNAGAAPPPAQALEGCCWKLSEGSPYGLVCTHTCYFGEPPEACEIDAIYTCTPRTFDSTCDDYPECGEEYYLYAGQSCSTSLGYQTVDCDLQWFDQEPDCPTQPDTIDQIIDCLEGDLEGGLAGASCSGGALPATVPALSCEENETCCQF